MANTDEASEAGPSPTTQSLAALSLLRLGSDTKANRAVAAILATTGREGLQNGAALGEHLCDALGLATEDRRSRLRGAHDKAAEAQRSAAALGVELVSLVDDRYPERLRQIADPPLVLWVKGDVEALAAPSVALVGSRRATPQGLATARRLGRDLARAGLVVVSGLARGIDGAAHRGALETPGRTLAVLGNGVDVSYPAEHRSLSAEVAAHGAIASEFPPGSAPFPSHFPLRNRIISGLSLAVVIVEASEKSGSLITARMALEQGRDVLAVPGNIASGCYRGCHALIKDGARLVETVEDILEEIGWARQAAGAGVSHGKTIVMNGLEAVVAIGETLSVDDLAQRTGVAASQVLAELGTLEVAGKFGRLAGGYFVRLD